LTKTTVVSGVEEAREDEDEHQHHRHLDPPDRGVVGHPRLEPAHPVHVLLVVEEERQAHHHQEGAAEGRDGQVRVVHDARVFLGLRGGEHQRLDGPILAAITTMRSGKRIRIPNTAIRMPQVRKRRCHSGRIVLSLLALTMALSKDSEISSTASTGDDEEDAERPADRAGHLPAQQPAPEPRPMAVTMKAQRK
jgi:hypothetical protein